MTCKEKIQQAQSELTKVRNDIEDAIKSLLKEKNILDVKFDNPTSVMNNELYCEASCDGVKLNEDGEVMFHVVWDTIGNDYTWSYATDITTDDLSWILDMLNELN